MIDGGTPNDGFQGSPDWEQLNREVQDRPDEQLRDVGGAAISSRPSTDRPPRRTVWGASGEGPSGGRPGRSLPTYTEGEPTPEPSLGGETSAVSGQSPPQAPRFDVVDQAQASPTRTRGQERNDTTTLSSAGLLEGRDNESTVNERQGVARRGASDSEVGMDAAQRSVDNRPSLANSEVIEKEVAPADKEYVRKQVELAEGYLVGLADDPEWRKTWLKDTGIAQVEALREQRPGKDIWVLVADAKGDAVKFIEEARKAGYDVGELSVFDGLNSLSHPQKAAVLGNAVSEDGGGSPSQYASVIRTAAEGVVREYNDPESGATIRVRGAQSYDEARDALRAAYSGDPETIETLEWEEQEAVRRSFGRTRLAQDLPIIATASRYMDHLIPNGVSYEIGGSPERGGLVERGETNPTPEAAPHSNGEVRVRYIHAEGHTDIEQAAQEQTLGFELVPMVAKNTPSGKPDVMIIGVDGLPGRAIKQVVKEAIDQGIAVVLAASEVPNADVASSLAKRGVRAYGTPDLTQADSYSRLAPVIRVEEVANTTGSLAVSYSGGDHESLNWEPEKDSPTGGTTSRDRDGWNVNKSISQTVNHHSLKSSAPIEDLIALQPGEAAVLDPRGNPIGVYDMETGKLIKGREFPTPEPEAIDFDKETERALDHYKAGGTQLLRMNSGLEVEAPPDAKGEKSARTEEDNPSNRNSNPVRPQGLKAKERDRVEDVRRLRPRINGGKWRNNEITLRRASKIYEEEQRSQWVTDVERSLDEGGKLATELIKFFPEWSHRPPTSDELKEAFMLWHDIRPGLSRRVGRAVGDLASRMSG